MTTFPTRVARRLADFDDRSTLDGTLVDTDAPAMAASYKGASTNGYARGLFHFDTARILEGQELWIGAEFYLPTGLLAAAGYCSLFRRDNWPLYGSQGNTSGIAIYGGDNRLHAECDTYDDKWGHELGTGVVVPEGRWFKAELHERVGSIAGSALTELYVDGVRVSTSTAANNLNGRPTDRVRFGVVAVSVQEKGFGLQFRNAYVAPTRQTVS